MPQWIPVGSNYTQVFYRTPYTRLSRWNEGGLQVRIIAVAVHPVDTNLVFALVRT